MGSLYPRGFRNHQCLYVSLGIPRYRDYPADHLLVLCWSADAQHLAAYRHYDFYENTLLEVTLQITVAWGWLMFAINTLLTGAIVTKIL